MFLGTAVPGAARLLILVLVVGCMARPGHAERTFSPDQPFELTADVIEVQHSRELYIAEGDVRIVQEERRVRADWIAFNNRTRLGVAAGGVEIFDGEELIRAELVEFNIDTLDGLIFLGEYDTGEGGFRIRAEVMEKLATNKYAVERGTFTTCRCSRDGRVPWSVSASSADVNIGGYGLTRNTTFNVLGVPVLWFPWLMFPVKTERESGLLFPYFGYGGRLGFGFGVPIFWAARENVNVILTPRYMSKRGLRTELEVETVYGKSSYLRMSGAYLRDQGIDEPAPFSKNRWFAEVDLDQELPGPWRLRADVQLVSDNQYLTDFGDLPWARTYRYLESEVFAFANLGRDGALGMLGAVDYADDLQNPDNRDRDAFLLQRAPHLRADWLSTPIPRGLGFVGGFDVDYIHFTAHDSVQSELGVSLDPNGAFADVGIDALPDDLESLANPGTDPHCDNVVATPACLGGGPENDLGFQEGEPLGDRGHRIDLWPRVAYPFRIADRLQVYPEIGYAQTFYSTDYHSYAERGLYTARLDIGSRFRGLVSLPGLPTSTHVLEPKLGWAFARTRSQEDNPLFVPGTELPARVLRGLTLDNVTLDTADRIANANILRLGVENRFYVDAGSALVQNLRAEVELSFGYDFERGAFDDIILDGATNPRRGPRTRFTLAIDPEGWHVDEALLELSFSTPRIAGVGLVARGGYRYRRQVPRFYEDFAGPLTSDDSRFQHYEELNRVSQVSANLQLELGLRWDLIYRIAYSLDQSLMLVNAGGVQYRSRCECWSVGFQVVNDRTRELRYLVSFNLLGLGDRGGTGVGFGSSF